KRRSDNRTRGGSLPAFSNLDNVGREMLRILVVSRRLRTKSAIDSPFSHEEVRTDFHRCCQASPTDGLEKNRLCADLAPPTTRPGRCIQNNSQALSIISNP